MTGNAWLGLLIAAGLWLPGAAVADGYPSRPIRFIVPNGYGGTTDLVARSIAQKMGEALGQQVVVDNRPGSGGIVGTETVARSPADGYTLLMGTIGNLAISPHLYRKLAYDPLRDFAAVTQLAASAYVLVVHPSVPAQSVRDFVTLARAKPGAMNSFTFFAGSVLWMTSMFGWLASIAIGVKSRSGSYGSFP